MKESPKKKRPPLEPETYELVDPDAAPSLAPSIPEPQSPSPDRANKPTYDLEEPANAPRAPIERPELSPASAPPLPDTKPRDANAPTTEGPAFVDPVVASRKREEARIHGTEMAAWHDQRRRRRQLVILGLITAIAAGVAAWWYVFKG